MLARAFRATILDGRVYRQIGDDPREMFTSLMIVVLSGAALGLGVRSVVVGTFEGSPTLLFVLVGISSRITGWFLWAGSVYILGTKIFGGKAGFRALLRGMGLAFAPGILSAFAELPVVGFGLLIFSMFWIFAAGLLAIRETQQFGWLKALICNAIGWYPAVVGILIVMMPISGPPSLD